jgi:hypothetical protein
MSTFRVSTGTVSGKVDRVTMRRRTQGPRRSVIQFEIPGAWNRATNHAIVERRRRATLLAINSIKAQLQRLWSLEDAGEWEGENMPDLIIAHRDSDDHPILLNRSQILFLERAPNNAYTMIKFVGDQHITVREDLAQLQNAFNSN